MKAAKITAGAFLAVWLCSCATVLPEASPDHQAISALIRTCVQNDAATIDGPIGIEVKGNKATAYYTVKYRTAQQPWNPMKSTLVKQDAGWVLKESKSTKPWYYRYK